MDVLSKILFVDDDPNILTAFRRNLRNNFEIVTAGGGTEAITVLKEKGPFAVVVSDYRMPQIDGIHFLARAQQMAPDTVRIMLTGQADMRVVIDAVNEGNIFRFLIKPCSYESIVKALSAAVEQNRLIAAERVLLTKTLKGTIRILMDILSIVNPLASSQLPRLRNLASRLATRLGLNNVWEVELAAMLSQIGYVAIPNVILEKKFNGENLSENENDIFMSHSNIGRKLLVNIPRLEKIAEAISYQFKQFGGGGMPDDKIEGLAIPIISRILKVILDFEAQIRTGKNEKQSIEIMLRHREWYDPEVLAALEADIMNTVKGYVIKKINLHEIMSGMILGDDIKDKKTGAVLISKGQEITDVMKMRLYNYIRFREISEPIKILKPFNEFSENQ